MSTVTIHQAKTNLSKLIERAAEGEEIIIARGSKPVARLIPVGPVRGKRQPGSWKGRFVLGPEFFEPMSESELAEWE
ncbi:MAG TPA: type II toxin-antitoxin system Phd/YefM family antitoxin [Verrucomicrobiae bacterium]|nr:type II toxin-antitoxin system Phd/YefM family antitoxin [Verrucomicrobiae bacterium]